MLCLLFVFFLFLCLLFFLHSLLLASIRFEFVGRNLQTNISSCQTTFLFPGKDIFAISREFGILLRAEIIRQVILNSFHKIGFDVVGFELILEVEFQLVESLLLLERTLRVDLLQFFKHLLFGFLGNDGKNDLFGAYFDSQRKTIHKTFHSLIR